jgi:general secretion pathway protein H
MIGLRPQHDGGRVRERAFSLVEVLIVVALIAGMSAVIISGSGMLAGTRLRSAATLIISGIRLGTSRANSTGRPVRMVFDLEERRVMLEETLGRMLIVKDDKEGAGAGADPSTEAEQAALDEARGVLDGPRPERPRFTPVEAFADSGGDKQSGRDLGASIRFLAVQTEHDPEPRVDGRAYLYFWPGGGTERAIIQLGKEGDTDGLTVVVSALTGRAKIMRGLINFEEPRLEGQFGEREEE